MKWGAQVSALEQRGPSRAVLALGTVVMILMIGVHPSVAQGPSDMGFVGPSHGGISAPTAEKPESKLWYVGGHWWADMVNSEVDRHHIYRLDNETLEWIDTGVELDTRRNARADAMWDPQSERLYVVSHIFSTRAAPTSAESNWGLLFRYSYDAGIRQFILDDGFPVPVTRGKSETLTIAKDSTGRLWVTYTENRRVMFNHSLENDLTWAEPQELTTDNANALDIDDISAIISFGDDKIGIAWSDQRNSGIYFAIHEDGAPPDEWTEEAVIEELDVADDHINLKADSHGRVYLASKTSEKRERPLAVLYVRAVDGKWTQHSFGTGRDGHTRPIVLIDEAHGLLHMFAAAPERGGMIYYKQTSLDNIDFSPGAGELVMRNMVDGRINNVTSTKQTVDETSGILILASGTTNRYYFNYFPPSEELMVADVPDALDVSHTPPEDAKVSANWPLSEVENPSPLAAELP